MKENDQFQGHCWKDISIHLWLDDVRVETDGTDHIHISSNEMIFSISTYVLCTMDKHVIPDFINLKHHFIYLFKKN